MGLFHFLSTEENQSPLDGVSETIREKEHVIVARILNFAQLKKADSAVEIEQYTAKVEKNDENATSGAIRVRKITNRQGETHYEMTVKNDVKEGKVETSTVANEMLMKQLQALAKDCIIKHRYSFKVKGTDFVWHVDLVPDNAGGYKQWCLCECEVTNLDAEVPELPLETEEAILCPTLNKETNEETFNAKKKEVLEKYFIQANPLVKVKGEVTKLKGEDKDTEEKTVEVKTNDSTTGEETLSVDNITDDKETANKVEERKEQITEKQQPEEEDKEDTTEESKEEEKEGEEEPNSGESNTEEDSDTEVSQASFRAFLADTGIEVSTEAMSDRYQDAVMFIINSLRRGEPAFNGKAKMNGVFFSSYSGSYWAIDPYKLSSAKGEIEKAFNKKLDDLDKVADDHIELANYVKNTFIKMKNPEEKTKKFTFEIGSKEEWVAIKQRAESIKERCGATYTRVADDDDAVKVDLDSIVLSIGFLWVTAQLARMLKKLGVNGKYANQEQSNETVQFTQSTLDSLIYFGHENFKPTLKQALSRQNDIVGRPVDFVFDDRKGLDFSEGTLPIGLDTVKLKKATPLSRFFDFFKKEPEESYVFTKNGTTGICLAKETFFGYTVFNRPQTWLKEFLDSKQGVILNAVNALNQDAVYWDKYMKAFPVKCRELAKKYSFPKDKFKIAEELDFLMLSIVPRLKDYRSGLAFINKESFPLNPFTTVHEYIGQPESTVTDKLHRLEGITYKAINKALTVPCADDILDYDDFYVLLGHVQDAFGIENRQVAASLLYHGIFKLDGPTRWLLENCFNSVYSLVVLMTQFAKVTSLVSTTGRYKYHSLFSEYFKHVKISDDIVI